MNLPAGTWARFVAVLAAALLHGVLATLAFAPFGLFPLAWVAAVPVLWLASATRTWRGAFAAGWLAGMTYFAGGLWYLWHIGFFPMLGGFVYLALYTGLFALVWRAASRGLGVTAAAVVAAVAWVGVDYVRAHVLTGLPYLFLGHTQLPLLPAVQIADAAGAYAVTFWVLLINAAVFAVLSVRPVRHALPAAGVAGVTLAGVVAYGLWRHAQEEFTDGPRVVLVQPSVPLKNTEPVDDLAMLVFLIETTRDALAQHDADLVVWPESSVPSINPATRSLGLGGRYGQTVAVAHAALSQFSAGGPAFVVGGGYRAGWQTHDDGRLTSDDRRNSAYFYADGRQSDLRYDKVHLFPFGEYIPFAGMPPPLSWAHDFFDLFNPWGDDHTLTPGDDDTLFPLAGINAVVPICFEDIIPQRTRRLVYRDGHKEADMLVNITNDGWFRGNQMAQHLQAAAFRSVENRVPTVRSVNTGVSAIVDPAGRVTASLASNREGIVYGTAQLDARVSPYGLVGDAFAALCLVATGALVLIGLARGRDGAAVAVAAVGMLAMGCASNRTPVAPLPPPVVDVPVDAGLSRRAAAYVAEAAGSPDPARRVNAAEAAEALHADARRDVLVNLLDDDDAVVRFAAALGIGRTRTTADGLTERLAAIVRGEDVRSRNSPNGRLAAAFALHRLGDTTLSQAMVRAAAAGDPVVRSHAALTLGLTGEPSAAPALQRLLRDPDPTVRLTAAEALWRNGHRRGLETLMASILSQFADDATIATLALGGHPHPSASAALEGQLSDDYPEVRLAAARALGRLASDRGYAVAAGFATDTQPLRRGMAAAALGDIGRLDAQPTLARLLDDADPGVRLAAAAAVLRLTSGYGAVALR